MAKSWVNLRRDAILFFVFKIFFHFVKKLSNGSIRRFNEMSFPGFHEDSDSGCKAQVRTTRQSGLPSRPEWIFLRSGKPDFPPKMSELFRNHWFLRVVGSFSVFGGADVVSVWDELNDWQRLSLSHNWADMVWRVRKQPLSLFLNKLTRTHTHTHTLSLSH